VGVAAVVASVPECYVGDDAHADADDVATADVVVAVAVVKVIIGSSGRCGSGGSGGTYTVSFTDLGLQPPPESLRNFTVMVRMLFRLPFDLTFTKAGDATSMLTKSLSLRSKTSSA
jgi:hypothetical protein